MYSCPHPGISADRNAAASGVFGAGAIGGITGGLLSRAGHDVTFIDTCLLYTSDAADE